MLGHLPAAIIIGTAEFRRSASRHAVVESLAANPHTSLLALGPECNNARLQTTYGTSTEIWHEAPPPPLPNKLSNFVPEGLCLHDDAVRDVLSDILLVDRWNEDPAV